MQASRKHEIETLQKRVSGLQSELRTEIKRNKAHTEVRVDTVLCGI